MSVTEAVTAHPFFPVGTGGGVSSIIATEGKIVKLTKKPRLLRSGAIPQFSRLGDGSGVEPCWVAGDDATVQLLLRNQAFLG